MPTGLVLAQLSADIYKDQQTSTANCRPVPIISGVAFTKNFYGGAYVGPGNVGVIVYRGSKELEDFVYADGDIARDLLPVGEVGDAFSFFSACRRELSKIGCLRLIVTGHSLGGGLAALVAAAITSVPVVGVTFNAPGMAGHRKLGKVINDHDDRNLIKAIKDVDRYASSHPLLAVGAFQVAIFEATKKAISSTFENVVVQSSAYLDIPKTNIGNVFNYRSKADIVSGTKNNHIGTVIPIENAGYHPLGPLIERLKSAPEGSFNF